MATNHFHNSSDSSVEKFPFFKLEKGASAKMDEYKYNLPFFVLFIAEENLFLFFPSEFIEEMKAFLLSSGS